MPSAGRIARIFALWTLTCWLLIGLPIAPVVRGGWLTIAALAVLGAAPLAVLLRGFVQRRTPSAATRLFVLRPFWYVQLALPLLAIASALGMLAGLFVAAPLVAGRWTLALAGALLVLIALVGYVGSRQLVTRHFVAEHPALPDALDGLRIVQLSDLHVGPHTSRGFLARIVEATHAAAPDLIAITGDQVDDHAPDVMHFADAFRALRAPLGVFAIPGNHDVYAGWPAVRDGLSAMGLEVLVNDAVPRTRGDTTFWVAGTGDPAAKGQPGAATGHSAPDPMRTLARVPAGAFHIVLAHNPALWPALAQRGVPLTLSGHTHYGQFAIPQLGWSLASPFLTHAMGSHREGDALLYINPGTNSWGLPLRIGALPEVTVITLRRGGAHPQFVRAGTA